MTRFHDIALLKLKEKVDLTTYKPACLAPKAANYIRQKCFSLSDGDGQNMPPNMSSIPPQPGFEGDNSNDPQQ